MYHICSNFNTNKSYSDSNLTNLFTAFEIENTDISAMLVDDQVYNSCLLKTVRERPTVLRLHLSSAVARLHKNSGVAPPH